MALVKLGGGVIGISGSIAGNTFARNRFGSYVRARTKPVNPESPRQTAARLLIIFLAEQWREDPMTATIREAWETYANSVGWNNRLGELVKLTGYNHFIRSNAARMAAGGDLVTAAPIDLGLPNADPTFAVTGSESSVHLSVVFDNTLSWANETGGFLSVEMGVPQNPSRNSFDGPWRNAGAVAGDDTTPPTSPEVLIPPFTLIETQKVWTRARIIRTDARCSTQWGSAPFLCSA